MKLIKKIYDIIKKPEVEPRYLSLKQTFPEHYTIMEKVIDQKISKVLEEVVMKGEVVWKEEILKHKVMHEADSYFIIKNSDLLDMIMRYK